MTNVAAEAAALYSSKKDISRQQSTNTTIETWTQHALQEVQAGQKRERARKGGIDKPKSRDQVLSAAFLTAFRAARKQSIAREETTSKLVWS